MSDDDFDTTGPEDDSATTLASAYLDGDVTTEERALVETDPDALDEVRRLGDVRTVLAGTAPPVSLSERESHLAAALDVWERMSDVERSGEATSTAGVDGAAAAALSTRRSSRRRRAKRRSGDGFGASQWFLSAAAVLVVVAGGVGIVRGILDDEGVQDDVALDAAVDETPAGVENNDALERGEVDGENTNDDGILPGSQIEGEVTAEVAEDQSGLFEEESSADAAAAESSATDEDAAVAEGLPEDAIQPSPAPEDDLPVIEGVEDLAAFGALVIPALENSPIITSDIDFEPPDGTCERELGVQQVAGVVIYEGATVTVGVDLDAGVVLAYIDDSATTGECTVVERTPLPDPGATPRP